MVPMRKNKTERKEKKNGGASKKAERKEKKNGGASKKASRKASRKAGGMWQGFSLNKL